MLLREFPTRTHNIFPYLYTYLKFVKVTKNKFKFDIPFKFLLVTKNSPHS